MTLKAAIKKVVGAGCTSSWARFFVRRSALRSVNIVYYHHVGEPGPHYKSFFNGCTPEKFESDLKALSRVFDFAALDDVLAGQWQREQGHRPILAVTFDDGFDLRSSGAMDQMAKYGVKATTFVITSCIGNRRLMWRHALSAIEHLTPVSLWRDKYNRFATRLGISCIGNTGGLLAAAKRWDMKHKDDWTALLWNECGLPPMAQYLKQWQPYFDWNGLREWIRGGHAVGFHTHTHPYCSLLPSEAMDAELIKPAMNLKSELGIGRMCFSYPFGDRLRPELENRLAATGLFDAFLGIKGSSRKGTPRHKLERIGVEGDSVGWSVFASHAFAGAV